MTIAEAIDVPLARTGLTRRRRVGVTAALALAGLVALANRVFEGTGPALLHPTVSGLVVLITCGAIVALVAFCVGRGWVMWIMIAATVSFETAQIVQFTAAIPALDAHPVFGGHGAYRTTVFQIFDSTGLILLILGFVSVVFELSRARVSLVEQGQALEREIQGREQAATSLAESETRYQQIVENASDIIFEADRDGRFTYANGTASRISGYSGEELVGKYVLELVVPEARAEMREINVRQIREAIDSMYMEFPALTKRGSIVWIGQNVSLRRHDGAIVGVQAVARDITERRQAELALRNSEERYRLLVEATGVIPWEADAQTFAFSYIGPQAVSILGYPSKSWAQPGFWAQALHPDDREEAEAFCLAQTQQGRDHELSYRMMTASGDVRWIRDIVTVVSENNAPKSLRGIFVDITEIREAEEERRQFQSQMQDAQKLESLGVLAGGIAHDFNNLLAGILGNADLALQHPEDASESLQTIVATAKRAGELCQQLLAYSGKGKIVVQPHDLTSVVRDMGELLELPVSKRARISYALDPDLPTIEGDVTQIRQVILNLITNATESLQDSSGVIYVCTGMEEVDESLQSDPTVHGMLEPGPCVFLEVGDSGCGMDRETQTRMFDPFYTTKFSGRGLGLAAVLGIMRSHHGAIRVRSKLGRGTTIRVYFPASGRPVPIAPSSTNGNGHWRGEGAVLVVDDEAVIRNFVSALLYDRGFDVITAVDGVEAVREYRNNTDDLVAVVLDLTMPNMDGAQAYREMREIREGIPVIVISGYSEADVERSFADSAVSAFVQKPFKGEQLLAAVKEAVAGYG